LIRQRLLGLCQAPVSETAIMVDGSREPFVTVGTPNGHWPVCAEWAAAVILDASCDRRVKSCDRLIDLL